MKVYVLINEYSYHYEHGTFVDVFSDYNTAKANFMDMCETAKEDFISGGYNYVINENEDSFEIYEDGYYDVNHTTVSIVTKEVK